ncbi:universal stress protein [Planosporangium thailandense]|uniref:Universal stress protein n=1 Tax=Planosporangium thailandense TaxID=765197 RepID=A0ABX0Y6M0_9ACTN|nr:universal stress protein [Planosporangium thailandense]NJC74055.1 universal stress protein [Planosporangium thailandense]
MTHPVIVGVDGSPCSLAAVDAAAREAAVRGAPLHVIYAYVWPYIAEPIGPSTADTLEGDLHDDAEQLVREAAARARAAAPTVDVRGEAVPGPATPVLVDRSRTAALVVIGDRGLGGFSGLLLGSVAVELTTHAAAPVLVVRGRADPRGDVLLGVDGSPGSEPAVAFAFEEAALRGAGLTAVHAWDSPVRTAPDSMLPPIYTTDDVEDEEERVLAESLAGWRCKYPDVPVRRRLVCGPPRPALLDATGTAQLLVVGSRGRGGFTGLLLGSVSQAMVHHAACPVAVVHRNRTPARAS